MTDFVFERCEEHEDDCFHVLNFRLVNKSYIAKHITYLEAIALVMDIPFEEIQRMAEEIEKETPEEEQAWVNTHILNNYKTSLAEEIESLKAWPKNWKTYGGSVLSLKTIEHALLWFQPITEKPHVTVSQEGAIVLEWWNETKKLTIYIDENSIDYLKSWDEDSHIKMEDGLITSKKMIEEILTWLKGENNGRDDSN
jgi:hypothetical protein